MKFKSIHLIKAKMLYVLHTNKKINFVTGCAYQVCVSLYDSVWFCVSFCMALGGSL